VGSPIGPYVSSIALRIACSDCPSACMVITSRVMFRQMSQRAPWLVKVMSGIHHDALGQLVAEADLGAEDVRAALRAAVMGSGRAVLTVAHCLAAAQDADRVVVMEAGPPDELMRRGGRFAALLELEAAGWDWQTDGRSVRP
jgi:hypothetical protein